MTKLITVNERGALTLPKEARDKLGVTRGGQLLLEIDQSGGVTLRAGVIMPLEIYSAERVQEFHRMNEAPLSRKEFHWRKSR